MVIRFLITKTLITAIMKELVVITEITVIKKFIDGIAWRKKQKKTEKQKNKQTNLT